MDKVYKSARCLNIFAYSTTNIDPCASCKNSSFLAYLTLSRKYLSGNLVLKFFHLMISPLFSIIIIIKGLCFRKSFKLHMLEDAWDYEAAIVVLEGSSCCKTTKCCNWEALANNLTSSIFCIIVWCSYAIDVPCWCKATTITYIALAKLGISSRGEGERSWRPLRHTFVVTDNVTPHFNSLILPK